MIHRIAPAHAPQHGIVAGLHRQLPAFAHLGQARHGIDDALAHLPRVGCQEAKAPEIVDLVPRLQDVGQIRAAGQVAAIVVHVLAQEHDLARPAGHQCLGLSANLGHRPAALRAAAQGHQAIGAVVVAAVADGHHVRDLGRRQRHLAADAAPQRSVLFPGGHENPDALGIRGREKAGHEGVFVSQRRRVAHETAHHQQRPAVFLGQGPQRVQPPDDLVLGTLAHHAGVQQQQVGLPRVPHRRIAPGFQCLAHAAGVGAVHLAADVPQVIAPLLHDPISTL
jgi:hypothetical protein